METRTALPVSVSNAVSKRRLAVIAGAFGNLVEWYDWAAYGLFASVFAGQFFPASNPTISLTLTLATFALGFVVRPLGSVLLSPYGDRHGRRALLALTVLMMGAGSLVITVIPSYAAIGPVAPAIFLVARLVQGISAGAEFGGSSAFLVEHARSDRRAMAGAWQLTSIGLATLVATGVAALVTSTLGPGDLHSWGWRLPFALGAVLALVGLYLRRRVDESPSFERVVTEGKVERRPLFAAFFEFPKESLRVIGICMGGTLCFYIWTVFLPTYAHLTAGLPLSRTLTASLVALAIFTAVLPAIGWLSDAVTGRRPLLLIESIGFVLLAYPFFLALKHGNLAVFLAIDIAGCVLLAFLEANLAAVLCEQFPARVRATGIGVPYAIATAIFGGTAPLICAALAHDSPIKIAGYVAAIQLVSAIVFWRMPETRHAAEQL